MKQIKVNPNNEKYYSSEFIKGFNCGAQRQFEADMADRKTKPSDSEKPNNCETCRFDDRYGDESICKECARHYSDNYAPIEDEPQTDCPWK